VVTAARRTVLLLAWVAAAAVAAMAMAAVASADPPPQANASSNASCFGKSESADQGEPGPGTGISREATTLAHSGTTSVGAHLVPFLQEATHTACQGQ
jgi:hypothetical protein